MGQTHPQLLYGEKTEFGNLGRKVLTLDAVLAGEKEKEPSHTCRVVMEKVEPGSSGGRRARAGPGDVQSRYKEKHFPLERLCRLHPWRFCRIKP